MFWGGNLGLSVTPQDVRIGKTFSRDGKTVENGELNLTNLRSENIKSGVNIAGVTGDYLISPVSKTNYDEISSRQEAVFIPICNFYPNFGALERFRVNFSGSVQLYMQGFGSPSVVGKSTIIVRKNGSTIVKGEFDRRDDFTRIFEINNLNKNDIIEIERYFGGVLFGFLFKLQSPLITKL